MSDRPCSHWLPPCFQQAARSSKIWEGLFRSAPWEGMLFPTEPCLASSISPAVAVLSPLSTSSPTMAVQLLDSSAAVHPSSSSAVQLPWLPTGPEASSAAGRAAGDKSVDELEAKSVEESRNSLELPAGALNPLSSSSSGGEKKDWRAMYREQAQAVRQMQCPRYEFPPQL